MTTTALRQSKEMTANLEIADFLGRVFSFNNSLKLHHWSLKGTASYARHIALDQAIGDLSDTMDRLVETAIAMRGDLEIVIPETPNPTDIVKHAENFFNYAEAHRELFAEAFTQAIVDDYQEAIQQLLYRLKRLQLRRRDYILIKEGLTKQIVSFFYSSYIFK